MISESQYDNHLWEGLKRHFSREELRDLCFAIGIDYENIKGDTKDSIARELIAYCRRRYLLDSLITCCADLCPQFPWRKPDISASAPSTPLISFQQGLSALESGMYVQAVDYFEETLTGGQKTADTYYYLALAKAKGVRPRLLPLAIVQNMENLLQSAVKLNPNCTHAYLLWALVKYDYYILGRTYESKPQYVELRKHIGSVPLKHCKEIHYHITAPDNEIWEMLTGL